MALPAIQSIAAAFPLAHIHAFTGRHSAPVFRASEHIALVYRVPDQLTTSRVPGLAWNLRTAGHDWIVVLDRSRLLKTAARAANPPRLITLPRPSGSPVHEIDVYLRAIEAAGVPIVTTVPRLAPEADARQAASEALDETTAPYAVLHPGGGENPGTVMLDKRWQLERYARVARELADRGLRPVLTGGPDERQLCDDLAHAADDANCLNLAGSLGLMATAAVIENAHLYIGADTGVSHLAAAVGAPSVVIFGPTNPLRYAPRNERVTILAPEASGLLPDIDLRKPPASQDRPSTREVTVDMVLRAIDQILANRQPVGE
jgi:heptosyltransferase II